MLRRITGSTALSTGQSPEVPVKLLSRCEDVTMKQFVACICDNDLSQLVVQGSATAEQLAEAWTNLFLEYCDLAEQPEVRYSVRLQCEVSYYRTKIEVTEAALEFLKVADEARVNIPNAPVHIYINLLKDIGFEQDLDWQDRQQFLKDLARIEAELRPDKLRLMSKEVELAAIKDGSTNNEQVERKYFTTVFTRINNYCKREAVNMQTTVEMYCAALRDYVSGLESNKVKD